MPTKQHKSFFFQSLTTFHAAFGSFLVLHLVAASWSSQRAKFSAAFICFFYILLRQFMCLLILACGVSCYRNHENSFVQLRVSSSRWGFGTPELFKSFPSPSLALSSSSSPPPPSPLPLSQPHKQSDLTPDMLAVHCSITDTFNNVFSIIRSCSNALISPSYSFLIAVHLVWWHRLYSPSICLTDM